MNTTLDLHQQLKDALGKISLLEQQVANLSSAQLSTSQQDNSLAMPPPPSPTKASDMSSPRKDFILVTLLQDANATAKTKTNLADEITQEEYQDLHIACKETTNKLELRIQQLENKLKKTNDKHQNQLAEFKEQKQRMSKLEERLEAKDCELIQLRSQMGGLEAQCLKIKLAEVTVRLEERDKQLVEVKEQLKEWAETANKLINSRADFDEFKTKLRQISNFNSVNHSPQQSYSNSQDGHVSPQVQTDSEDDQMRINTNEVKKEQEVQINIRPKHQQWQQHNTAGPQMYPQDETCYDDDDDDENSTDRHTQDINVESGPEPAGTKCPYCCLITSKTLEQHWKECDLKIRFNYIVCSYGKQWKQVLAEDQFVHISEHSQFKQMFSEFCHNLSGVELNEVQQLQEDLLKANDIDSSILYGEYYCSLCKSNFISFGSRFHHYQNCVGLKRHYEGVKQQMLAHKNKAEKEEQKKIQTVVDFGGNILRGVVDSVNLIKELTLTEKKAKEIYGDNYTELLQLHKELHRKDYFKGGWLELVAGPVADADGNPVYAQYTTRENLINVLGKRRRCGPAKIAREVITKSKQDIGIPLLLAERRDIQAGNIKELLKKYLPEMLMIREWLKLFKDMKSTVPFKKVQGMFCDGFILPRLKKTFPKYYNMEAYLRGKGLQVQHVCPGAIKDCVYVRLEDSANQFSQDLVDKLNAMIADLKQKVTDNIVIIESEDSKVQEEENEEEDDIVDDSAPNSDEIYLRQIDYTQDLLGFFVSFDVSQDCKDLAKLLNITTRDYKSFDSCLYLLREENIASEDSKPIIGKRLRFKIYNKLLHFLQSEQTKKKISMNLKGMLLPSNAFYQKMLKCEETGMTRLEFSHYFYSFEEQTTLMNVHVYQDNINNVLKQVNKPQNINYNVPFKQFWKNFWSVCKSVFVFEDDTWAVVYAKNPISAYAGQQVKINNTKDKLDFIKRFGVPGKWSLVIDASTGKVYRVMKKGKLMQLPIQSLNTTHQQKYDFDLGDFFKYDLSESQLSQIELVAENGVPFEFEPAISKSLQKKRDKKTEEKKPNNMKKQTGVRVEVEKKKTSKKTFTIIKGPLYQNCLYESISGSKVHYKCNHCNAELHKEVKDYYLTFK